MANRLKNIFSKNPIDYKGTIRAKDSESSSNMREALTAVYKYGETKDIPGNFEIFLNASSEVENYPLYSNFFVNNIHIEPTKHEEFFDLDLDGVKESVEFKAYSTEEEIVLEKNFADVVSIRILLNKNSKQAKFNYTISVDKAENVSCLKQAYDIILGTIKIFFEKNDDSDGHEHEINNQIRILTIRRDLCKKLLKIEERFSAAFKPEKSEISLQEELDIEELFLLYEKREVIRQNAKGNGSFDVRIVDQKEVKEGETIHLSFVADRKYSIWGEDITISIAGYVINAVIKKIETKSDGVMQITYGQDDTNPMYVAIKAFGDEDAAKKAIDKHIDNMDIYVNAKTVLDYLNDEYGIFEG